MQGAVSVERQVTKSATVSATYLNSRGFDQFITINANAPYPGTPCAAPGIASTLPTCATVTGGNLYRYVSEGNFKQNQLIVNTNIRVGTKLQLFGFYTFGYANSDTSGISSFPTNSYDISQDYGRGSFDVRNRLFLGGSIGLPYLIRLSPFMRSVPERRSPSPRPSTRTATRSTTIVRALCLPPPAPRAHPRQARFTARSWELLTPQEPLASFSGLTPRPVQRTSR
jgi:hypothetical protein